MKDWLLVIFEILPSSVGTDDGNIVAATNSLSRMTQETVYKHVPCQIFMNITGTCWNCNGWGGWQGRWGCLRAYWSPWNHFKSICIREIVYKHKHAPCQFWWTIMVLAVLPMVELLMDISGTCWTLMISMTKLLRVSKSIMITWDHFKAIYLWKMAYKHAQHQFFMDISGTCLTP